MFNVECLILKGTNLMKPQYITPEVQVSTMLYPASMLCVSMQKGGNGDPISEGI